MLAYIHEWKVFSLNTNVKVPTAILENKENRSTKKLYEEKGVQC